MLISDLNYLEAVSESIAVQGGTLGVTQNDNFNFSFYTKNSFETNVNSPKTFSNSAAAGAKADAVNPYSGYIPSYSFTKADTFAVTYLGGGSTSGSTSVAVINPIPIH